MIPASTFQPVDTATQSTLIWPDGSLSLQRRGAMIRDLTLRTEDGSIVRPLHTAPWVGTPEADGLTGLMRGLSGEWPCVPFGVAHDGLPTEWTAPSGWEDPFAHGYGAHHDWEIAVTPDGIEAQISYPADHPIQSLLRRLSHSKNGITIELWVQPRRDCRLPIGLHPVFSLSSKPQSTEVIVHGANQIWSHPQVSSDDPTPARENARSASLETIQSFHSSPLDFSRLPRLEQSETRLLALGCDGRVTLRDRGSGIQRHLDFDPKQFPFVMLWVSNQGRAAAPWSRRHLALGIEPVRAAFDLGTATSAQPNPLSATGQDTAFELRADQPFYTRYSISVSSGAAGPVDSR